MALRYEQAVYYPRMNVKGARGNDEWGPDMDNPVVVRVGVSADRSNRAELRGVAELEVSNLRMPVNVRGVGPGGLFLWRGAYWDVSAPPLRRFARTHSVRHFTVQIRKRPYEGVGIRD